MVGPQEIPIEVESLSFVLFVVTVVFQLKVCSRLVRTTKFVALIALPALVDSRIQIVGV